MKTAERFVLLVAVVSAVVLVLAANPAHAQWYPLDILWWIRGLDALVQQINDLVMRLEV